MKRNVLDSLRFPDDGSARRLARFVSSNDESADRIFDMSEKRLEEMKRNENVKNEAVQPYPETNENAIDVVTVKKSSAWVTPLKTAAAAAAVLVIGVGAFGILHTNEPPASIGENIKIKATPDVTAGGELEQGAESDVIYEGNYWVTDSGGNMSKLEFDGVTSACAVSEAESSAAQTHYPNSGVSEDSTSDIEFDKAEASANEEILRSEVEHKDIEGSFVSESDEDTSLGHTTVEKLLAVTADMTYEQVIALLGEPDDLLVDSYAQYIVDDRLLMLKWDYITDPVLRSGKELYDSCPSLRDMLSDTDNLTFDCYVVDYNGASIRVTCPQYPLFDCATVGVGTHSGGYDEDWNEIVGRAMSDGRALRITHTDEILETYPPHVYAVSMELAPE